MVTEVCHLLCASESVVRSGYGSCVMMPLDLAVFELDLSVTVACDGA